MTIDVLTKLVQITGLDLFKTQDAFAKALIAAKISEDVETVLKRLLAKYESISNRSADIHTETKTVIRAAYEMVTREEPFWDKVAGVIMGAYYASLVAKNIGDEAFELNSKKLIEDELLFSDFAKYYSDAALAKLKAATNPNYDYGLTYAGIKLLTTRYTIHSKDGLPLEPIQTMYMRIAMFLAIPEKTEDERVKVAIDIYHAIASQQVSLATPILSNSRKPLHQMSSCFVEVVPDSLLGIYNCLTDFAQVSKHGGGMGIYIGKVRALGSDIRGFKGAAGGVIRWAKLFNDTAIAVDQLGMRQGAVAVYLDIWHKDVLDFMQVRTNNGDDRLKAHDIFPALCIPNHFWDLAERDRDADWHLFCPHEIQQVMGFNLEDTYGDEWLDKYNQCIANEKLSRKVVKVKEVLRLIIKSAVETGTPFIFNRDLVNEANPLKHKGIIYSSNLCTEIAQNMRESAAFDDAELHSESDLAGIRYNPGEIVVCNLASLVLGNINVSDKQSLRHLVRTTVRLLDNVVDLNRYPLAVSKLSHSLTRSLGIGVSGYHHLLCKEGLKWESEEHLKFNDDLFEHISYYAIEASKDLVAEIGRDSFPQFEGSDWHNGSFFTRRSLSSHDDLDWDTLKHEVASKGMRNAYLMAVAPTSSTSIITGTTAGIDPIMNAYYIEEKKGEMLPRVAPDLSIENVWLYKSAHLIDQNWSIRAAGLRQRYIDQAQSLNLYVTHSHKFSDILNYYLNAYKCGVKTIYYVRSKSLEVEECVACAS